MESAGTLLAVLTPLFAVPLTVIIFYLRSLREHQTVWHADFIRRVDSMENTTVELRRTVDEFERDYTTKEEWLRECMHTRRMLEQLKETTIRIAALLESRAAAGASASRHGDRCEGGE